MLGIEREVTPNETALSLAPLSGRYVVVSRRCTMIYLLSKQLREIAARENVDLQARLPIFVAEKMPKIDSFNCQKNSENVQFFTLPYNEIRLFRSPNNRLVNTAYAITLLNLLMCNFCTGSHVLIS